MEIICKRCGGNNWKASLVNYNSMLSLMCEGCKSSMITVANDQDLRAKGSYFKERTNDTITHYAIVQ